MELMAVARPPEAVQIWRKRKQIRFRVFFFRRDMSFFFGFFSNAHSYFYFLRSRVSVYCRITADDVEKGEEIRKKVTSTTTKIHLNLFVPFAVQTASTEKRWTSVFCGVLFEHIEYSFYLLCANAVIARTLYTQR